MKRKMFNKKLSLGKETVTDLNAREMTSLKGGASMEMTNCVTCITNCEICTDLCPPETNDCTLLCIIW